MKFKLPAPIYPQEMRKIIANELRKQKISVRRPNKQHLKELADTAKAIQTSGLPAHLICKKLPNGIGHGIFLHPKAKPLLKGQIIGIYSGELALIPQNLTEDALYSFEPISNILLTKDEQIFFDRKRRYHPRRFYAMHVNALKKGNFTRFINHSGKPNLVSEFFMIPENTLGLSSSPIEVVYLASKTIHPGEQLLISYDGDDNSYWGAQEIKPLPITPKTFQINASLKLTGSL